MCIRDRLYNLREGLTAADDALLAAGRDGSFEYDGQTYTCLLYTSAAFCRRAPAEKRGVEAHVGHTALRLFGAAPGLYDRFCPCLLYTSRCV